MCKLEVGKYYICKEDKDIIKYLGYKQGQYNVIVISDPNNYWTTLGQTSTITDFSNEYNYTEHKAYNSPLWRLLNE